MTKYGSSVSLPKNTVDLLRKLCKKYDWTQPALIQRVLEITEYNDLLNKNWENKLTASLKRGSWIEEQEQMEFDSDRCPAIAHGEEKFKCVWGRKGKPPLIRLLEKEYSLSKDGCGSCRRTLEPILENIEHKITIQNLKDKLNKNADLTFKAPVCEAGGILNGDGTEFSRCQDRGGFVDVKKYCKKRNEGKGCTFYSESVIGFAEKIE